MKQSVFRIKQQMKRLGVTQRAVAAEAGVTPPMVSNVMAGRFKSRPLLDAAERLIAARQANGGTPPVA